ncbi:5,10-methylenetetrahydrofolate reductase [Raphidocelis subcapitata]|uniref:5,10-methylenetetrahydrofolate reductase n=1 Tax=Raphidocelis subcapitata TaxID=307507 RepID=A0A2V0P1W0_9CHLO|nr:5,10-methylenetetrahydrofolate reductase [Raphidocelis subcapitata]|eukprot:GBF91075.1 5,10-methylenetetrahydrofolate reductase [Raphidocelis subcapitata]
MKIIDKINDKLKRGESFWSCEFFPPRTEEGVENLFERLDRIASYGPLFCDITWGAGGTTADVTLDIAKRMQNMVCVETMMHLTCTNMPVEKLNQALDEVRAAGIQNILALRGDPPKGQEHFETVEGGFSCALDLVRHIRATHGDHFGIGVAGYPEAHPDAIVDDPEQMKENYWKDVHYLKAKLDAGADFVVTQLFYEADRYIQFVKDCRSIGITAPILPGIMPVMAYGGFKRMTGFCKTAVPAAVAEKLEAVKDDDEAVKNLNLERSVVGILEGVGLLDTANVPRSLPWRHVPGGGQRAEERVRPIFWSNRPKAYITRTANWDAFPNGRWGNARSAAYATLTEHPFMRRHTGSDKRRERAAAAWGEPKSVADVAEVFVRYCSGDVGVLPWAEMEELHRESGTIKDQLVELNRGGYLTINSQPRVNGVPSNDATYGWGRPGGYVYQKEYVEFFCAPDKLEALLQRLGDSPSVTYLAVNAKGEMRSNTDGEGGANAVTWGVFPGKEVEQPTVVDPVSFGVWKDEAFGLWLTEWGALYEEGSPSRKLLQRIHDTWWLVSVVDNDYVGGNLFKALGV